MNSIFLDVLMHYSVLFLYLTCRSTSIVSAYSWIDCFGLDRDRLYSSSTYDGLSTVEGLRLCDGHGAGYPGRLPGSSIDYKYEIPQASAMNGAQPCDPKRQGDYSDWRKRLTVNGGDTVYYSYFPNGHASDIVGVPKTVQGIYWSLAPLVKIGTTLDINSTTLIYNPPTYFDDSSCGDTYIDADKTVISGRAGDGKPCIGKFEIPNKAAPGRYYMIWFWANYINYNLPLDHFAYTTCFEVDVVKSDVDSPFVGPVTLGPPTSSASPTTTSPPSTEIVGTGDVTHSPNKVDGVSSATVQSTYFPQPSYKSYDTVTILPVASESPSMRVKYLLASVSVAVLSALVQPV